MPQQNKNNSQFEFLDVITILSFAAQLETLDTVKNSDIIKELHNDVEMLRNEIREIKELLLSR